MSNTNITKNTWQLGFAFGMICSFWAVLFLYSIHSAMPYNAIRLPYEDKIKIQFFLPQGWKFFTRSPREQDTTIHSKNSDGQWASMISPNASPEHLFGIIKTGRARAIEMGMLMKALNDSGAEWTDCKETLQVCAEKTQPNAELINLSPYPTICGEVTFMKKEPVPWAWNTSKREIIMPSKINRSRIICQ